METTLSLPAPPARPGQLASLAELAAIPDKRAIFTAAAKAQAAADWMHARQHAVADGTGQVAQARAA